jgi:hypothetical protein
MILPASLCGLQGEVKTNTHTNMLGKPARSSRISLAALPESKNNVGGWNKSNPLRGRPAATMVAAEVAESSLDNTSSLDQPFDVRFSFYFPPSIINFPQSPRLSLSHTHNSQLTTLYTHHHHQQKAGTSLIHNRLRRHPSW